MSSPGRKPGVHNILTAPLVPLSAARLPARRPLGGLAGDGTGERGACSDPRFAPWPKVCRSFGADLCSSSHSERHVKP